MLIYVYKFMENKLYPEDNWHRRTANINNYSETNDCFFHSFFNIMEDDICPHDYHNMMI